MNTKKKILSVVAIAFVGAVLFLSGQWRGETIQLDELKAMGLQSENYNLDIYKIGEGEILNNKDEPAEGTEKTREYKSGEDVFLVAYPVEGHYFYSWAGCDGFYAVNNVCWVSMNKSKSVTAVFEREEKAE